jgi:DNA modification methylase
MTYTTESFLGGRVTLFGGDNRKVLIDAPDNSVESILTDGPYALVSIVKRFGGANAAPAKGNEAFVRASRGFMGKEWDTGEVVNDPNFWTECLRVLKPGGHLLSFGGTRTYHRMACAVEDAGFEIRDMIQWLYGSGFPKSHDVSKGIDKAAGVERVVSLGKSTRHGGGIVGAGTSFEVSPEVPELYAPATDEAKHWEGWGTALKPANEPIVLARKPLSEKTVAANVLKWGTGAINIDGCRVEIDENDVNRRDNASIANPLDGSSYNLKKTQRVPTLQQGRFPANVITDGSDEVVAAFPVTGGGGTPRAKTPVDGSHWNVGGDRSSIPGGATYCDFGSAARFFYQAKANKKDRANSKHPTVKPIALMRYLARLITPPGGTILDPFAGSGTTGEAAYLEGFSCYLIEREQEYLDDIAARFLAMNDNEPAVNKVAA